MEKAKQLFDVSDYKLQFMMDCARELRLCRLALKWSYPYIYCMKDVDKHYFDVLQMKQAKLEKYTDLLHEAMADVVVNKDGSVTGRGALVSIFNSEDGSQRQFNDFRTRIMQDCKAINNFRLGLCEAAQNSARKIVWEDVEISTDAKKYRADGQWLAAQGHL